MGERIEIEGGTYGLRPDEGTPIPNRTDAAWERLLALRAQAAELGIAVDDRWSIAELEDQIARHSS